MAIEIVGSGDYIYERVPNWPQLPDGVELGQAGIAADSKGEVYFFNRSDHPMVVVDRDGAFLRSWGEATLTSAHGIFIDQSDRLYLPVVGSHAVLVCDGYGNELDRLGNWGVPSNPECTGDMRQYFSAPPAQSYEPFSLPTDVAVGPDEAIYVTDGYANARVQRFDREGNCAGSWGEPGSGPGQFRTPHGVWAHDDGRVFVADRENHRIQIFMASGEYLDEWDDLRSPCDIFIAGDVVYIAEGIGARPREPLGAVSIRSIEGAKLAEWSHTPPRPGHSIWVDTDGSILLNQTVQGDRVVKYRRI
jgi:hypothetical protein